MITTKPERIRALTAEGSWGTDTLHGLLAGHVQAQPQRLAVKDQPNREQLTGDYQTSCEENGDSPDARETKVPVYVHPKNR